MDTFNIEQDFKIYFEPLCNYVNHYLDDWDSSREVVQGVFRHLSQEPSSLLSAPSTKTNLYIKVREQMMDYIQKNKNKKGFAANIKLDEIPNDQNELESFMMRGEILKSMDTMKPQMKNIFTLSKIEGLTYSEIASFLGITKRTAEDNVARALRHIKDDLKSNPHIFG